MQTNRTILSKAWLEGTTDFQQRIPNPEQYGLSATVKALKDPLNGDLWNQFNYQLNNTIGYSIISSMRWNNPYNTLRLGNLRWGNSIREIMVKWLKTHTFSDTSRDLLDVNKPEFEQWYYSVNYQAKIPWDLNRAELLRAMSGPDGSTAINDLYYATAVAALNTDDLNIAEACTNCISEADKGFPGGLYRHAVPIVADDDKKNAKSLLKAVRKFTYDLTWPSTNFNSVDVPVFANTGRNGQNNELFLITSSDEMANIEVDAYAELFNMSEAELAGRILVLPELPIQNARLILTTDTFIHWHDTVYGIYNFFNPDTLNDKSILHHQAIIAPNPSVPCIVFTNDESTELPIIVMNAQNLSLTPDVDSVELGGTLDLNPRLVGTVTANDDGVKVAPDSATYTVETDKGTLNTRTFVDRFAVLHVQKSGLPVGAKLTVTATSVYDASIKATAEITVEAPNPEGEGDEFVVSYSVAPDGTYGAPADAKVPESVFVVANGTVKLADKLTTAWTTSDGTSSGAAGTWTFTGWGSTNAVSDDIKKFTNIEQNKTAYGKWAFAAS